MKYSDLKDNQLLSGDGQPLTLQNPTFKEAEMVWPDGSTFWLSPYDNSLKTMSERNKKRFLKWFEKEVEGLMSLVSKAATNPVASDDRVNENETLVWNKKNGFCWLRGKNGENRSFQGYYPIMIEGLKACVNQGFRPTAVFYSREI